MPGLILKFRFFFETELVPVRILVPPATIAFSGPPENADMIPVPWAFNGPPPLNQMQPDEDPELVGASDK